ncbi:MAG TPA: hypothetical protein VFJ57_06415 [Solirubrobacterales bacterium]|nr:hypothetical protein [Solirubrobacterales bacterium]
MAKPRFSIYAVLAIVASLVFGSALATAKPQLPKEPRIAIPRTELEASFHCHAELAGAAREPVLFVTGTGATGEQGYLIGQGAFDAFGHPVCDVDFPDYTTADIQVSVQYLVYAIRRMYAESGRRIAIVGISQGGLLPRFALTYWPSLRPMVTDVLAAAGTQHGSTVAAGTCSATVPCPPAIWQQAAGSNLLKALDKQPLEAPGPTAWTTVRSATDEAVQPTTGPHPTSALRGAANILIQAVCPGRVVTHIGTAFDSVTFAAFADAISHKGPAEVSRLPADVCAHPFAPGLNEALAETFLSGSGSLIASQEAAVPRVTAEPKVRAYVKRPMVE